MRINFFSGPSRAENSFRICVCSISLLLSLICVIRFSANVAASRRIREELSKDAFCAQISEGDPAYTYRELYGKYGG